MSHETSGSGERRIHGTFLARPVAHRRTRLRRGASPLRHRDQPPRVGRADGPHDGDPCLGTHRCDGVRPPAPHRRQLPAVARSRARAADHPRATGTVHCGLQPVRGFLRTTRRRSRRAAAGRGGQCVRRQHTAEVEQIMRSLAARGYRLHAFGAKVLGLGRYADAISSSDSASWSFRGRYVPGCTPSHRSESNCPRFALAWHARLQTTLLAEVGHNGDGRTPSARNSRSRARGQKNDHTRPDSARSCRIRGQSARCTQDLPAVSPLYMEWRTRHAFENYRAG